MFEDILDHIARLCLEKQNMHKKMWKTALNRLEKGHCLHVRVEATRQRVSLFASAGSVCVGRLQNFHCCVIYMSTNDILGVLKSTLSVYFRAIYKF
jgi:hypothetical protein